MKNNYNEGNTACAIHWPCFSSIHKILTPKVSWFCDKLHSAQKGTLKEQMQLTESGFIYLIHETKIVSKMDKKYSGIKRKSDIKLRLATSATINRDIKSCNNFLASNSARILKLKESFSFSAHK